MNNLLKSSIVLSIIGFILFVIFLLASYYISQQLWDIVRQTFQRALVTSIYDAINKYILSTFAVSALGLSRIVNVKGFNVKIFLLFFIIGVLFSFGWLITWLLPVPVGNKLLLNKFLLAHQSFGSVITGVGVILSIRLRRNASE